MRSSLGLKPVALTFDDGPVEPYTSQILQILLLHDVKATFFVIGSNVQRFPDTARSILRQDHVVANHTQHHNPWLAVLPCAFANDILACQKTVSSLLGVSPVLVRPCNGIGFGIVSVIFKHRLTPVGWDVSSQDWSKTTPSDIIDRVLKALKPGAIVLLHDGHIPGKPRSAEPTVKALPGLIQALKEANYSFLTVPELFGISPYHF